MIRTIEDGLVKVTGTAALYCGTWKRVKTRIRTVQFCTLSGKVILRGDLIYRPKDRSFNQRVLASVMEDHARRDDQLFGRRL